MAIGNMNFSIIRIGIAVFSALLGLAAFWTLVPELLKPRLPYFPINAGQVPEFQAARGAAASATYAGWGRGDLWVTLALAEVAPVMFEAGNRSSASGSNVAQASSGSVTQAMLKSANEARSALLHAAKLSPHDARIWTLWSYLESRSPNADAKAAEALKLAYYTAPNEFSLAPLRLSVAGRLQTDDELKGLIQAEIQAIVLKRPDLKPAIATAYETARPAGRELFEASLIEIDPRFLDTIAPSPQR